MSHREKTLSSEQALDEYFCALLDDVSDELSDALEAGVITPSEVKSVDKAEHEAEPEPAYESELEPALESEMKDFAPLDFEAPDLDDVERLLSQLESSNVIEDLGLDEVLEQNTTQIIQEIPASNPVIELLEHDNIDESEEIQEWDCHALATIESQEQEPELLLAEVPQIEEIVEADWKSSQVIDIDEDIESGAIIETQADGTGAMIWTSTKRDEDFQVLYFDVNGVTFAVPLDELGGIHKVQQLNHLIGRPIWYLGLQNHGEQKIDVVDTARWVMADRLRDEEYKESYQYVVMLDQSMWGLASHELLGTETLNVDKIRWREQAGKRPWLAGMVMEKMCAFIHVKELIKMLDSGLDVKSYE